MTSALHRTLSAGLLAAFLGLAATVANAAITSVAPTGIFPADPASGATATIRVSWTAPDNTQGPMIGFLCSDINQPDPPSRFVPSVACDPAGIGTAADAHLGPATVTYNSPPGVSPYIDVTDTENAATVQRALAVAIARGQPPGARHFWFIQQFASGWALVKYHIVETPSGAPTAVLSTSSLDFGSVQVGTTAGPLQFTLKNGGTAPLTIAGVQVFPPFAVSHTCGGSVAAGATCTFNVTFTPPTVGQHAQTLSITTNASASPHTVALRGTGIPVPIAGPALAPAALNFGSQQVNTGSATQSIVLSNVGTAPLNAIVVGITGDFTQTNNCGPSLPPNGNCTITVRFSPTLLGGRSGLLTVSTAAGTVTAPLAGSGTAVPVVNPSGLIINVSPRSVSVNIDSPTTAALTYTFAPNSAGADPVDALFCSTLSVPVPSTGATSTNPCAPGSEFARLPTEAANFQTTQMGPYRINTRETLRVPAPVARYAYSRLREGAEPVFYLVRRFAPEVYTVVALRLAGNLANQPLGITDIRVAFVKGAGELPLAFVKRNEPPPQIGALLYYTGAGILRGRWEVVLPGDVEPTAEDLVPEASLPFPLRGSQRRYQLVERFQVYLPATGRFVLPGPDVSKLPVSADGQHRVLLRLEAEPAIGGTDPGLLSGGAAPFPLPTLRYFVGSVPGIPGSGPVQSIAPDPTMRRTFAAHEVPEFRWLDDVTGATVYRLEVRDENDEVLVSALLRPGTTGVQIRARKVAAYQAPPFVRERIKGGRQKWQVTAVTADGSLVGQSAWRTVQIEK